MRYLCFPDCASFRNGKDARPGKVSQPNDVAKLWQGSLDTRLVFFGLPLIILSFWIIQGFSKQSNVGFPLRRLLTKIVQVEMKFLSNELRKRCYLTIKYSGRCIMGSLRGPDHNWSHQTNNNSQINLFTKCVTEGHLWFVQSGSVWSHLT